MRICFILLFFSISTVGKCNELTSDKLLSLDSNRSVAYVGGEKISPMEWGKFDNILLKIDFNNNQVKKISGPWSSDNHFIRQVELSPDGQYLTLIDQTISKTTLYLIDTQTDQVIETISHMALVYDWDPHSKSIAYIKGSLDVGEEHGSPFNSAGVYLYSIDQKVTRKLSDSGYQILWASHDGNIYLDNKGHFDNAIIQANPVSGKKVLTEYKDLNFSRSGKYYCHLVSKNEVPIYPAIYTTFDNKLINNLYRETYTKGAGQERNCIWGNKDLLTLYAGTSFFVFDVSNGLVIRDNRNKRINGKYIANEKYLVSVSHENHAVIYNNGYWELQELQTGRVLKKVSSGIN